MLRLVPQTKSKNTREKTKHDVNLKVSCTVYTDHNICANSFHTHQFSFLSSYTVLRPNITDITITPSPSDNNLLHEFNDTVSLTCTAEGGPRIMTRWQFDDGSSVETVADGSNSVTYVVSSLSTDHTGVYYCEAIIDGMTDTSMNYTLFGKHSTWIPCS